MAKGEKSKKKTIRNIVLSVLFVLLCVIPFGHFYLSDGGSEVYCPIIPWYMFCEYNQLGRPIRAHNGLDGMTDEEYDKLPEYIIGYGVRLFGFEIWCDKYYQYTDGHTEKIPWSEARKLGTA